MNRYMYLGCFITVTGSLVTVVSSQPDFCYVGQVKEMPETLILKDIKAFLKNPSTDYEVVEFPDRSSAKSQH